MNKYIIISQYFKGQVEILYIDGKLAFVDFQPAEMDRVAIAAFLKKIPAQEPELPTAFNPGSVEIIQGEMEILFETFWNAYKKKVNPKRCRPLWAKLSKSQQLAAFNGIKKYNAYLIRNDWLSKMDPETYLRNERWLDEYR